MGVTVYPAAANRATIAPLPIDNNPNPDPERNDRPSPRLLSLPFELKRQFLRNCLIVPGTIRFVFRRVYDDDIDVSHKVNDSEFGNIPSPSRSILRVGKDFQEEGLRILYGENKFEYEAQISNSRDRCELTWSHCFHALPWKRHVGLIST